MKVTIVASTVKAVIGALQADATAQNRWVKATDALRADGVTSAMLASKGGDKDLREFVKAEIVVASFTAKDQALLDKKADTLSDEQKTAKRYLQQQVGSKFAKIESHLKKAEAKAEAEESGEGEGEKKSASIKARLDKDLAAWIVRLEKCEASDFKSLPDVIKAIKTAQVICNQ